MKFKNLFLVVAALLVLTGCNAVSGLGKDVEELGEKLQDVGE